MKKNEIIENIMEPSIARLRITARPTADNWEAASGNRHLLWYLGNCCSPYIVQQSDSAHYVQSVGGIVANCPSQQNVCWKLLPHLLQTPQVTDCLSPKPTMNLEVFLTNPDVFISALFSDGSYPFQYRNAFIAFWSEPWLSFPLISFVFLQDSSSKHIIHFIPVSFNRNRFSHAQKFILM